MEIKSYEYEEEIQEKKEFIEELIYENIKLMGEINKLAFENSNLEKKLEELKRLNKYFTGSSFVIEGEHYLMIFKEKGCSKYRN